MRRQVGVEIGVACLKQGSTTLSRGSPLSASGGIVAKTLGRAATWRPERPAASRPQQCLKCLPLPQGQGRLRDTPFMEVDYPQDGNRLKPVIILAETRNASQAGGCARPPCRSSHSLESLCRCSPIFPSISFVRHVKPGTASTKRPCSRERFQIAAPAAPAAPADTIILPE
jgi:hypothetical protein